MKNQHVIIRVPEPCHEDWNKMTPDAKGKFCASCATSVVDFSKMTDDELKTFLIENKGQKTCGHFKRTQLNKPILISVNLNDMPVNMSASYKFVVALFIVFGTFLFSCTDQNGKSIKDIQIENSEEKNYVMGMMIAPPPELVEDPLVQDLPPPPPFIESYEISGAMEIAYEETLTGDVVMVEEPNVDPVDSCSFDGVELVGFSPPYVVEDSAITQPMILGGLYIDEFNEDEASVENEISETVEKIDSAAIEQNLKLVTNWKVFPNPSNGNSTIQYYLQKPASVRLDVFDISGKHVKTLVNQASQHTGIYHIPFNGANLTNGIYMISLIINGESQVEKLIIEK